MSSILTFGEINLLINSEEPKNIFHYGNLYDAITQLNCIKSIKLDELTSLDKIAAETLLYNKETLINKTMQEWIYTKNDIIENSDLKCSWCNRRNKHVFYITNLINDNVLNVGSTCIGHFPKIQREIQNTQQNMDDSMQIIRRTEFINKFPNIEDILKDTKEFYKLKAPYIQNDLRLKLMDSVIKINTAYNTYIKYGTNIYYDNLHLLVSFEYEMMKYYNLRSEIEESSTNYDRSK